MKDAPSQPRAVARPAPSTTDDDEIDLMELFRVLWRGKWVIILMAFLAMLFGGYYAIGVAEPQYRASAELTLEVRGGQLDQGDIFPTLEQSWDTFNVLQDVIEKSRGTSVGEVMTEDPVTVRESTNLADAVVLLLERRIRRLPVVDESGCVVGLLSRADVIRSTLKEMKSR
mgnify:CR=1 FL=1